MRNSVLAWRFHKGEILLPSPFLNYKQLEFLDSCSELSGSFRNRRLWRWSREFWSVGEQLCGGMWAVPPPAPPPPHERGVSLRIGLGGCPTRPGSWKTASVTSQVSLFTLLQIILWKTSPKTGHTAGQVRGGKLRLML